MSNFTRNVLIASFTISGVLSTTLERVANRVPANQEDGYELSFQDISTTAGSKIDHIKDAYIRVVFNNKEVVEVFKDQKFSIASGESKKMDAKLDLKPLWIAQDGLEFRIELVESGFIENVRLRCSTISKSLSVYNRAYQCNVPGETAPIISYRVAKKGAPLPELASSVAKN